MVNYSFIVNELCEQKDNPNNMCMGKCHIQKEIKKSIESSNEGNNKVVIFNFLDLPHNLISNSLQHLSKKSKIFYPFNFLKRYIILWNR